MPRSSRLAVLSNALGIPVRFNFLGAARRPVYLSKCPMGRPILSNWTSQCQSSNVQSV
jgi:hypothetical protein